MGLVSCTYVPAPGKAGVEGLFGSKSLRQGWATQTDPSSERGRRVKEVREGKDTLVDQTTSEDDQSTITS